MNDEEMKIIEGFLMQGYKEGLIHGFVVGRGKPPRPEDKVTLDKMSVLMQKKAIHALLNNERSQDETTDQEDKS